ncbi:MAG: aminotransferase class I/II-fold pyridoxal phosphate-dependent enzyme, partial [Limisphaerales bacterium]
SLDLISAFEKIRQPFNINSVAQAAALAAMDDAGHIRKTRANNFDGLDFFERALRELQVEFVPSHGNFILVRVGDGARVFEFMQRQGVIVRPMGGYQLPEWVRISIGTPAQNERSLAVLKQTLPAKRAA